MKGGPCNCQRKTEMFFDCNFDWGEGKNKNTFALQMGLNG